MHFEPTVETPPRVESRRPDVDENRTTPPGARGAGPVTLALGLVLVTVAVFLPVRTFEFVGFDDPEYVTGNRFVQAGVTWESLQWAFTTTWASYWHPLTWVSHLLDVELFGSSAAGPHLVNMGLHAANAVLLFAILRYATNALWRSALVAALFALHPLHVESVAWVAERKDVLSAFFFLLSLAAYTVHAAHEGRPGTRAVLAPDGVGDRRTGWGARAGYLGALAFFAAALMSKPMVVTLPCVLLLWDFWPLRRWNRQNALRLVGEKLPFIALSTIVCVITVSAQRANGALPSWSRVTWDERWQNAVVAYGHYLQRTVWPSDLAFFYPHAGRPPVSGLVGAAMALIALSALAVLSRRRFPVILTGWLWFLGMLVPVIGLIQSGDQAMADRYTYLPLIGVFVALVWPLAAWWRLRTDVRIPIGLAAVVVVLACGVATKRQLHHWRDSETLFRRALAVTTGNFIAHNNLGTVLVTNGKVEEAITHFEAAIRLRPDYAPPYNNLATVLLQAGRAAEALPLLQRAVILQPDFAELYNSLGNAQQAVGDPAAALASYRRAIELRPDLTAARLNRARALGAAGAWRDAIADYRAILALNAGDSDVHTELALALLETGEADDGIAHLRRAVALRPGDSPAADYLGIALLQQGQFEAALPWLRRSAVARPLDAEARNNLGWALLQHGEIDAAVREFDAAVKASPQLKRARDNLALAMSRRTRPPAHSTP